jgi:CRISPR-associated protein Csh2
MTDKKTDQFNPIQTNSDILFIYDAKMTNPNGDMDNENKPRMDYDTDTNLVSDVRLKRYIRDYCETNLGMPIFVTQAAKDAKDRNAQLTKNKQEHRDLIDVRLFGAVLADTGANTHYTGPVQFNWGYSLNPVEINESCTITSSFSKGEGVGKDFRVKYSLIAFSGGINALAARDTHLSDSDIQLLDRAMIKAIPANRTRSKVNQTPRLYLRVQLNSNDIVLKDLRDYLTLLYEKDNKYETRNISDIKLDVTKLADYLEPLKDKINSIVYWLDDQLELSGWDRLQETFTGKMVSLDTDAVNG